MKFDFDSYKTDLYAECKAVFPQILADYSHEDIYGLALYYSCAGWGYLFPTVFTRKGLAEIAAMPDSYHPDWKQGERGLSLKWSSCDSPHHTKHDGSLKKTAKTLNQFYKYLEHLSDKDEQEGRNPARRTDFYGDAIEQIRTATLSVLKRLKDEDILAPQTDTILLTLLSGDQGEDEIFENAAYINSPSLFKAYQDEMNASWKLY